MIRFYLFFCGLFLCNYGIAQKKIINHTAYEKWKKIERQVISNNGDWIAFETTPLKGDGFVCLVNLLTNKTDTFIRGKEPKFNASSNLLLVKIAPGFDTLRSCELNKVEKSKWPKDSLYILALDVQKSIKVAKLKQVKVSKEGGRIAFLTESVKAPQPKKKWCCLFRKKDIPAPKSKGGSLVVLNNSLEREFEHPRVTEFEFTSKGDWLSFITHEKVLADSFSLNIYGFNKEKRHEFKPCSAVELPSWTPDLTKLVYLSSADTSNVKQFILQVVDVPSWTNWLLIDSLSSVLDSSQRISHNRKPFFSKNGKYMFFGAATKLEKEKKDSLLESEKVHLDIWHYQDQRIQPQQLLQLNEDQKKTDLYLLHLADKHIIKISNDTLRVSVDENLNGDYVLAVSDEPYAIQSQWKSPSLEDIYRIHLPSNESVLVKSALGFGGSLSPKGQFYAYFDAEKKNHFLIDIDKQSEICVTCDVKQAIWQEDINGQPMPAGPIDQLYYLEDEENFVVLSEFDIWNYSLKTKNIACISDNVGLPRNLRPSLNKWSADSVYLDWKNTYVKALNTVTKSAHILVFEEHNEHLDFKEVYSADFAINSLLKSKNGKRIVLRKMNVNSYPEISVLDSLFNDEKIISKTNPQQNDYNWASVELLNWSAYDGTRLEGLLYKPEDFDKTKKYPLIIYYYELNSDNLHNHNAPKPSASTINPIEYASAGYLVFIPDIRYSNRGPAKSAFNCIMSGTDYLIKNFPVDSLRMGLQGQSWGGYQTAQLITMTTRYAAAMAGAPVGNMFSAYGGIRWGSGLNRQFQYESTQSRIGKTIWDAQAAYLENSPLFHLPNVSTPLLIMHNDKDGSVPWYQGIEIYNGMRRLNKPCWMLNYNDDDHNLTKLSNKMDLSIRMRQFFDHYLMANTAPSWMVSGIPAIKKGKETGY